MFLFSETQLNTIRTLKGQRLFPDAYRNIVAWAVGQDGVDDRSILWFSAAADINAGVGAFSTLIRSYTSLQHQYRYGTGLTPAQMQAASNAIADAVLADVLALRTVPALERLGALDAAGAAARIFNGDPALWSGNLLFLMLRDSGPFQAHIIQDEPDNPYDFLAMMKAFSEATGNATIFSSAGELYSAMLTTWQAVTGGGVAAIVNRGITAQSVIVTATIGSALASGNTLLNDAYDDRVSLASLITASSIRLGRVDIGDSLIGASGYDLMLGEAGNDSLQGLGGDDVLDGGEGADMLFGGEGEDDLFGRAGSDALNGGAGDDYLKGGDDTDFLTGAAGADRFILTREGGLDTILDPEAIDRIVFDGKEISGTAQNLDNGLFKLGNFAFTRQSGLDLMIVPAGGTGPVALIKNFFPAGYDGKSDVTLMGITLPKDSRKPGDLGIPGDTAKTSPIALDLNGDGLKYIPYTGTLNPPHFDIDNDGFAEGMEWLDRNDGFLVRDTNGNGRIDNQREMFGDDGGTTAYQKLALLDTNHDGKVSAADTGFSGLRIWQDLNSNGKTDAGELKTLEALQIVSLSLQLTNATSLNGHAVAGTSDFVRANGSVGVAADVLFDIRQSDSIYVGSDTSLPPPVDVTTLFLPLARGYGTLPALHYAMTQNPTLKAMVTDLATLDLSRLNEVYDRVYDILLAWGGAGGIAPTGSANDRHAAKLAVLQRFVDGDTSQINVDQAFGSLFSNMISKLLIQGPLKNVLPGMVYNFANDTIDFDSAFLQGFDGILDRAKLTEPTDIVDKSIYWTEILRIVGFLPNAYARVTEAAGFSPAFPARILGTSGNDILTGYLGATFQGFGGDDVFHAGPSTFMYNLGDGADTILKNPLAGPDQFASIYFGQGISFDALTFQVGGDRLVLGVPGNGSITFPDLKFLEILRFADGTLLKSYQFNFAIFGGKGTAAGDLLYGNASANVIAGLAGDDRLSGLAGNDRLDGGSGRDWLQGNEGADILDGSDGIDTAAYGATISDGGMTSATTGVIIDLKLSTQRGGDAEGDILRNIENIVGTDYDDFFAGDSKANFFEGWAGIDTVSYASSPAAVTVDLSRAYTPYSGGDAAGDVLNNIDRLIGSRFDDVLTARYTGILDGAGGNDTLIGGQGREMLTGGVGRDIFVVRKGSGFTTTIVDLDIAAGETIRLEGFGDAGKFVNLAISQSGTRTIISFLSGQSVTLLNVDASKLTAVVFGEALPGGGTGGDDILTGTGGNDLIDGGAGADRMAGGLGDDIYFIGQPGDTVIEAANAGIDEIRTSLPDSTAPVNVENITGLLNSGQTLRGNSLANLIAGGTGADRFVGGLGDDVYLVGAGDNVVEKAGEGNDEVRTALAAYTLAAEVERLTGTSATGQTLSGNALANVLSGGAGADRMIGGFGNDVYLVGAGDNVIEKAGEGADEVRTALAAYVLTAEVERLVGTSGAGQALTGNALANLITGGAGHDRIDGGGGVDQMAGGLGNDVYFVAQPGDAVVEAANAGTDEVRTSLPDTTAPVNVENITGLLNSGQTLRGNALANIIAGGAGADRMAGGFGNDVYLVGAGDNVVEKAGEGTDEVRTALAAYVLTAEVERLVGTSAAGQILTGSALANVITGGAGHDRIDGGGGVDQMAGGLGNDVYFVAQPGDSVTEAANAGTDEVRTSLADTTAPANVENIAGLLNSGQTLRGNALANIIAGGAGADRMIGGLGNDVYLVGAGDNVIEKAGEGTDEVRTALAAYVLTAEVERLVGTSAAGQALTGNALANVITGGAGHDRIDGGGGVDQMAGGLGNDVYFVAQPGDSVTEAANAGTDEVRTSLADTTAPANVENITGVLATGQTLRGNALGNVIAGGPGADRMVGGLGDDVYVVGSGDNVIEKPGEGADEVRTALAAYTLGAELERLVGTSATQQALTGNGLANIIVGGNGADMLRGGGGADSFRYLAATDSYSVARDHILDFTPGTDKIDLGAIDANRLVGGDQAFTWIGSNAFTRSAGQLRVFQSGTDWIVEGDVNGDGHSDLVIALTLQGPLPLGAGDFLL